MVFVGKKLTGLRSRSTKITATAMIGTFRGLFIVSKTRRKRDVKKKGIETLNGISFCGKMIQYSALRLIADKAYNYIVDTF